MKIPINDIIVKSSRREVNAEAVELLSESMAESGLFNPITVSADHTLIAGRHRLEAARLLGWVEIDCHVCEMDELHAELAEIDENLIRNGLSDIELSEQYARRKRIYEVLHPETKARNLTGHVSNYASSNDNLSSEVKPFAKDTAEKTGMSARTVQRYVRIGERLTRETKDILAGSHITRNNLLKLTRLEPVQQADAAAQLVSGRIKSVDEYVSENKPEVEAERSYYCSGAFLVNEFTKCFQTFTYLLSCHQSHSKGFQKLLSEEQMRELGKMADDAAAALQEYALFLSNEAENQDRETEGTE